MEAFMGLAIEIGKCIVGPVKRQFDYLCCFNNNIQILRGEAQKLKDANDGLQMKVDADKNDARVILPEVETWLENASQKNDIINEIENEIPLVEKRCLNLISRYSLSRKAKKIAEDLKELHNESKFDQISLDARPAAMESHPLRPKEEFETRKKIEEDVMEALRDRNVHKIGLCGMGGIGKTTMAERIMDRVKEERLFDEALKVVVSQQVEMLKIQQDIAEQLGLTLEGENLSARAHKIRTRLRDTKSTLVVLDDIWRRLELEGLGIPCNNNFERCKVLFTSRDRYVLEVMETQKIFGIQVLFEKEAWSLFRERTDNCADREDLRFVAENVAKECKGLPVALVTVGSALRHKTNQKLWENALSQLRSSNPTDLPGMLLDVYQPLKLSYDYLGNERAKSLFLLCSMFEEDSDINLDVLAWYGMGLGMFGESNLKEVRNRTHSVIETLKDGFLLLDGSVENCVRMHDVVRDMASYVASEEKRCGFAINLEDKLIDWAKREDLYKDCSWISISNSRNITKFPVKLKFPSLRLLRLERGEELSDGFFDEIREISVLSMTSIQIKSLPPTTQLLKNLQTLLLFNCGIESISVVGELSKLEVLCCVACNNIEGLPMEIGRLNHLRLLQIKDCENFRTILPGVISRLVSLEELQSLCNYELEKFPLPELKSVTRLTRLEIHTKDVYSLAQEICFPPNLEKYDIRILQKSNWKFGEQYLFVNKRVNLEIPGEMNLGNWVQELLKNAEYVDLEGDGANQVKFGELKNVKYLILESCSRVKKLVNTTKTDNSGSFHLLECLMLDGLDNLEEIIPTESNNYFFRNLTELEISKCPSLRYLFPASTTIGSNLLQLTVRNCEAMEDIFYNDGDEMEKEGTRHHPMVFPKLKILQLALHHPRLEARQILDKMEEDKIILVHRGYWDGSVYKNGEEELIFTSLLTISFEQFLDVVHGIVEADRRMCEYVLHCLIPTEDVGAVKSKIKSERDLQRVARLFRTPKIFVTVEQKHHGTNAPSYYGNQSFSQPGIPDIRQHGFVHLMASQGTYGNPFSYGGQFPFGHQFPTGYGMNYMHWQAPYMSAPHMYGAGPSSAPYLLAPHVHGAEPNSTPVVDQACIPTKSPVVDVDQPNVPPPIANVPPVEDQYERLDGWGFGGDTYHNDDDDDDDDDDDCGDGDACVADVGAGTYDDQRINGLEKDVDTTDDDEDDDFEVELTRRIIYDDYGWEDDDYFVTDEISEDGGHEDIGVGDHQHRVLRGRCIPIQRTTPAQRINLDDVGEGESLSDDPEDEIVERRRRDWIILGASFHSTDLVPTGPEPVDVDHGLHVGATFESKDQLVTNMGLYHLQHRIEYRVPR